MDFFLPHNAMNNAYYAVTKCYCLSVCSPSHYCVKRLNLSLDFSASGSPVICHMSSRYFSFRVQNKLKLWRSSSNQTSYSCISNRLHRSRFQ